MGLFNEKDAALLGSYIKEATKIVISTHINPDGDAIGSSVGFLSYLRSIGKDAKVIFPTPYPANLSFMIPESLKDRLLCYGTIDSAAIDAEACEKAVNEAQLLISVDYNSISRSGDVSKILKDFKGKKVLVDHHLNPDRDFYDLVFSTPEISSASELSFWLLRSICGGKLGKEVGTLLMTGMTTDTNNFANSVFPTTLEMTALLLNEGVDRERILDKIYKQYRENRFRMLGYILSNKLTISPHGAAIILLDAEEISRFGINEGEMEGFVNIPLEIGSVRLSIFVRKDGAHYRVSTRSKKGTSANLCSQTYFHGGGHEQAAGGRLSIPEDAASHEALFSYIFNSAESFLEAHPSVD